jgi:hypothetical protein
MTEAATFFARLPMIQRSLSCKKEIFYVLLRLVVALVGTYGVLAGTKKQR